MKLLLVPHAAEHVFQELQQQMAGAADVEQARLQETRAGVGPIEAGRL